MSATAHDVTPNLAELDVPMSEAAPNPEGNYNADPPCLPELFDDKGKSVPYVIRLGLGSNGIKKDFYDEKNEDGGKTGRKLPFFIADVFATAIAPFDGREMEMSGFNCFIRPGDRYTSFTRNGKDMSPIAHLAKIAGLDLTVYDTVSEMAGDLAQELSKKGDNAIQALAYGQWQWYSKDVEFTKKNGETKKGKVVRFGMKNADTRNPDDGSYSREIVYKETGETLTAKFVITRIEALA